MASSKKRPTPQEQIDARTLAAVDPYAHELLHAFADADGEVQKIEALIDTLTYDSSDVPWYIEWGPLEELMLKNKEPNQPYKPPLLNSIDFRRKLRAFLVRARRIARRVHFCAYWCYDEDYMTNWLKEYLMADAYAKSRMPAPFGVIEPSTALFFECQLAASELAGAGARVPSSRLEVEWYPPQAAQQRKEGQEGEIAPRGVKTCVFTDLQLNLIYPERAVTQAYMTDAKKAGIAAPVLDRVRERLGDAPQIPFVLPNSPIFDTMRFKAQLDEAVRNRQQAEGVLIQPCILLTVEPMKLNNEALQRIPQEELAVTNNATEALINNYSQQQLYSEEEWEERQARFDEAIHPPGLYSNQAPASSQLHRVLFGRPHSMEVMHRFSPGMRLAHVHTPTTLIDVDVLDARYRQSVAEALGLSTDILKQISGGEVRAGGGHKGASDNFGSMFASQYETPAERHLQHVIQTERNWIVDFFDNVYTNMMNALDIQEIEAIHNNLHVQTINMREAKVAARVIETLLAREMTNGPEEKETLTKRVKVEQETAGTKDERKRVKVKIKEYRALMEKLRTRHDAIAKIVFQPGTTKKTAQQLQILLDAFYDRGLVAPAEILKFAKPVFGEDIKIERDPQPPLLPGKALSPADELAASTTMAVAKTSAAAKGGAAAPPAKKKKKRDDDAGGDDEPAKKRPRTSAD